MSDYLPDVYKRFSSDYPAVMQAYTDLAEALQTAGRLDERERRLVKLGIAIGAEADGAVRSHARQALAGGIDPGAIRQAAVLAITTAGFPAAMAAFGWV